MENPYVLATISAPENLAKLDKLVAINKRLADPRGLSEAEAKKLAQEGRAFYLVYATIHSTEVGNTQALTEVVHRLATDSGAEIRQMLDNVVLLVVPSQNPDGQVLVVDHWYKTKGTPFARVYPDLYHKYVGHDDNRDWFMFTQIETRLAVEKVHSAYKPIITHDMHQQGANASRIFVPPFDDPYDPNVHPILAQGITSVGNAMASALVAEGKTGIEYLSRYDLWAPARQYMVYHGQPRILTEIASVELADPFVNPAGKDVPLGPQEVRWNYPVPYKSGEWRLRQIVDYAVTATFAGIGHVAKNRVTWLENFYRVHADWINRKAVPYAFVLPAAQRDPYETYELLNILRIGEVEIHQAKAPFTAHGRQYSAGSWVIKLAQPYGAFAKTMLERQQYPDLRLFPGGPPKPPYDVTGHTLGLLMGVEVDQIEPALRGEPGSGADASPGADPDACATAVGVPRRARVERRLHRRGAPAGGRHRHLPRRPGIRERRPHLCAGNLDRSAIARGDAHPGRSVHLRGSARRIRRQAGAGRRVPPQAGDTHRPVAGRQQHAGRLDEVAVRTVRLQPPHDRVHGFHP